jgi:hypothetical protein
MASFTINEGGDSLFRSAAQNGIDIGGAGAFQSTRIALLWEGIPDDVTLNIAVSDETGDLDVAIASGANGNEDGDETIINVLDSDLEDTEAFLVTVTAVVAGAATEIDAATITVRATMHDRGDPLDSNDLPTMSDGYPRFAEDFSDPLTVGQIVAANTTLLVPYALKLGGFDTGITIANTTSDPFPDPGGATAGAGTIRMDFFPRTSTGAGTPFGFTTSASIRPGQGLSTNGQLASGGTLSFLLSEALTAAGQTGDFVGYIFIQTDFLLAHGTAFISDFNTFTSATNVLNLPPPAQSDRDAPGSSVEALNN